MALSNISILQDEIDQKIEGDLATFASGEKDVPLSEMEAVVDFYRMALDLESRERDSIENLRPYLEEIEAIATFEDYQKLEKERLLQAKALPYSLSSLTLSRSKYLQLEAPVLFLGDSFYYQDQASKEQYLESFRKGAVSLMQHVGYSKEESQTLVQQAMDFDELLVPYLTGSPGILTSSGNQNTELIQLMSTLLDGKETKIVVDEAVYFSNTDKIVNEDEIKYLFTPNPAHKKAMNLKYKFDSEGEWKFAKALDDDPNVMLYTKLKKGGFVLETPAGNYSPDWAIVYQKGNENFAMYFIAETKWDPHCFYSTARHITAKTEYV